MRVLFVDQFGKTTGRDTLAIAELINANSDIDIEVYLSDSTEIPTSREYTVKITKGFHGAYEGNAINKAKNYLRSLKELKEYIKKNNIDVVHLQWFSLPWIEWMYVDGLKKKVKIAVTVHDIIPFDNRPLEMQSLDKIYANADTLIMHTEYSKKMFRENYKVKTPISVVTQGFCLKSDYKRIDNANAKKQFGIPSDAVVFLYYGTIRPSKGLDILISAIHEAHKACDNVYLLAAGAFHHVNEDEYRNLVTTKLGDDFATVNFGFVPQEEEQLYFSAADVLCLPYLEVTQSGVAQLGLMYELPIIATKVGEMEDVARNGENGIIVDAGNIEQLSNSIQRMAQDEEMRKNYSLKSKQLGETEFSLQIKANKIAEVYRLL